MTRERRLVRKGGLEPPRYCYRQPLKLVRLPIPPLPRWREGRPNGRPLRHHDRCYFAGAGAGVAGGCCAAGDEVGVCCVSGAARPPTTDPGPRWPMMPSASAPTMNSTAQMVVARDSTVAP